MTYTTCNTPPCLFLLAIGRAIRRVRWRGIKALCSHGKPHEAVTIHKGHKYGGIDRRRRREATN